MTLHSLAMTALDSGASWPVVRQVLRALGMDLLGLRLRSLSAGIVPSDRDCLREAQNLNVTELQPWLNLIDLPGAA